MYYVLTEQHEMTFAFFKHFKLELRNLENLYQKVTPDFPQE